MDSKKADELKLENCSYSAEENQRKSRSVWASKTEIEFLQFVFEKMKKGNSKAVNVLLAKFWNMDKNAEMIVLKRSGGLEDQRAFYNRLTAAKKRNTNGSHA